MAPLVCSSASLGGSLNMTRPLMPPPRTVADEVAGEQERLSVGTSAELGNVKGAHQLELLNRTHPIALGWLKDIAGATFAKHDPRVPPRPWHRLRVPRIAVQDRPTYNKVRVVPELKQFAP
jgi:hypothetical protein